MADDEVLQSIGDSPSGILKRDFRNKPKKRIEKAISTARSMVRINPFRNEDPELGDSISSIETMATSPTMSVTHSLPDDPMVFRRFGHLHSRLLLYQQDELHRLQQELERLDGAEEYSLRWQARPPASRPTHEHNAMPWNMTSAHDDHCQLLDKIEKQLRKYSEKTGAERQASHR
ncbi:MAG: hypothetical protein Q9213_008094 [Squamulea squamosa]